MAYKKLAVYRGKHVVFNGISVQMFKNEKIKVASSHTLRSSVKAPVRCHFTRR